MPRYNRHSRWPRSRLRIRRCPSPKRCIPYPAHRRRYCRHKCRNWSGQLLVGGVLHARFGTNGDLVAPALEADDGDAGLVVLPGPERGDRAVIEALSVADVDAHGVVGLVRQSGQIGGHLSQSALDGNRRTLLVVKTRIIDRPVAEAPLLNLRAAAGKDIALERRRRVLHVERLAGQQVGFTLFERAEGLDLALHHQPASPGIDIARVVVPRFQIGKRDFERIAALRGLQREDPVGRSRVEVADAALRADALDVADANGTPVADLLDAGRFHDVDTFGLVVVAAPAKSAQAANASNDNPYLNRFIVILC